MEYVTLLTGKFIEINPFNKVRTARYGPRLSPYENSMYMNARLENILRNAFVTLSFFA